MNLIFDIDNTIYFRNNKELSGQIMEKLITLAKKHKLYFATRREQYNLDPITSLLEMDLVENVICGNGAYDLNNIIESNFLPNAKEIIEYLINEQYHFLLETDQGIKINGNGRFYRMEEFYNKLFIETEQMMTNVVSILIDSEKSPTLETIFKNNNYHFVYNEQYQNYSIANLKATKWYMIEQIVQKPYIAFGDSLLDDVEMLMNAEIGYLIGSEEKEGLKRIECSEILTELDKLV